MSTLNLKALFAPRSVAVIGASATPGAVGQVVLRNVIAGGYTGDIYPINPKYDRIGDRPAWRDVASLPAAPEMAIVCTPAATVPAIIADLGRRGTRAAVVLSAGFGDEGDTPPTRRQLLEAARPWGLRILGPNCIGFLAPRARLNASFAHMDAAPGSLALVAQSGALCTAIIDWARDNGVGFTHVVSLGDMIDVDFGDMLDYLGSDGHTRGILLYVESITAPRKFLSAARAACRNKPVIAIKAGRNAEGAKAARSHTGAMAGSYAVFESAFRRAGILNVHTVQQLFDAAESLALAKPLRGERLAILTNGGGPGVLATDALTDHGGTLASLIDDTTTKLDAVLPRAWSRGNPVDIIGDADADRYGRALGLLAADPTVDAILVLNVPTALAASADSAAAVIAAAGGIRQPILTCWLGETTAKTARQRFAAAGIPSYETPHVAIRAFLDMIGNRRNQELLMQTPPSIPEDFAPDLAAARVPIATALNAGRDLLTEVEAKSLLAAYGFPVVETHCVTDAEAAVAKAKTIGYPLVLKILSPDISHKSDIGGVALNLETAEAVRQAARGMLKRVRAAMPAARIDGFSLQRMVQRPRARELIVGAATDPVFGPVILFGEGGTAVEVLGDKAIALPPLNLHLARDLISRTRIYRLLRGYRDQPAADMDAIAMTLVRLSQLLIDLPEVVEADINPLLADQNGVIALDARVRVRAATGRGADRLAIRPYPKELEETLTLKTGESLCLRPIRPEDEPAHKRFIESLDAQDVYFRFFAHVHEFTHTMLARFTQIDYDREMAFIATRTGADGEPETMGVVRAVADADNRQAEFAVVVRSDFHHHGLGHALMQAIIRYCRNRGTGRLVGPMLKNNRGMIELARGLGFIIENPPDDDIVIATLDLTAAG